MVGVLEHEEPWVPCRDARAGGAEGAGLRGCAPPAGDATQAEVAGRREAREHALEHVVVEVGEAGRRALALLASGSSVQRGRHARRRRRASGRTGQ